MIENHAMKSAPALSRISTPPASPMPRRDFVRTALVGGAVIGGGPLLAAAAPAATTNARVLVLPLTDAGGVAIEGPHRFRTIAGRTGLHVTSLNTKARVTTDRHAAERGTLSLWFSPLEDLTSSPGNAADSKVAFDFPFVSDAFPPRDVEAGRFGICLTTSYPALVARFTTGRVFPKLDFGLAPFVYVEKVLLRRGFWYHLALSWDRPARRLRIWINGLLAGLNDRADHFETATGQIFIGNPIMVLRDLRIEDRALDDAAVRERYLADRPRENEVPDADFRRMLVPAFFAPLDLRRDSSWQLAYATDFTRTADAASWVRQGPGEKFMAGFRMAATTEGLLIKTPDQVERETRMYLWSPRAFEGDQWIEFDFRLEGPAGLALVSACASGMQREDFLSDHGVPKTGSMSTILRDVRNYHWEFMRRVEAMRTDVETQYVAKNPFAHRLHCACVPRLESNRWYRLRLVIAGQRLHGSFDGQTVFDLTDTPFGNNGPVYNFGRIGLRQMYHTALRYRNFSVHERRG